MMPKRLRLALHALPILHCLPRPALLHRMWFRRRVARPQNEIGERFSLPRTTVRDILTQAEKWENYTVGSSKRQRVEKFSDLEDALSNWFAQKRANNIIITDDLLREKAKKLGEQLAVPENFAYSSGWLQRFKGRFHISQRRLCGEGASISPAIIDEHLTNLNNETELFFQLIPDRTLAHKDENCRGVKRMKQRITVLLCCNSTGTDKRRLLIIGKSAKPRCFRNFSPHFYCTYTSNSKAWMTSSIFQEWLLQFNKQLVSEGRRILLFGIIKSFKSQYRKLQLQKMVELVDAHLPTELRLDYAVRYCKMAWDSEAEMKLTNDNLLVSTVTAKEELGEDDDTTVTQRLPLLREARTAAEKVLLFLEHSKRATSDDVNLSADLLRRVYAISEGEKRQVVITDFFKKMIYIPKSLRSKVLNSHHEGHLGIEKCRGRARSSVWWPRISQEIEELVRNCPNCIEERSNPQQPLNVSDFPSRPWEKVGIDHFYLKGKYYLLIADYNSRFPELALLEDQTTHSTIIHCKSIFAPHGILEEVRSDNGPQFGLEFKRFAKEYGFHHITSSPRFPQSNGFIESMVKNIKTQLKKGRDPYLSLLGYRTAPLENGYSSAELCMNRKLRTTVPISPVQLQSRIPDLENL
ncbi:K02A2.6-like [Cordylochernes scorpioides]|uniref:RNA-directed DNA polymerase n=1 Tax=Cordylochernes scorpioides TaxID=51811 RepID=A0ABY6LSH4_9ARAC|nr:K02A2.6-like [Cordylochernes scorpioides]